MTGEQKWSWVGQVHQRPRPNWTAAALALVFASQTFLEVPATYPGYMSFLALVGGIWFAYLSFRSRVLIGLLLVPVSLLWLNPLLGGGWFNQMGLPFFSAHAALAMLFGTAAYTYLSYAKEQ